MSLIPYGPWEPDVAGLGGTSLVDAKNVLPLKGSYGPLASLGAFGTDALPAGCVGAFAARTLSGGWIAFAGTRTKLYRLSGTTWTDYTRVSGGDYAVAADEFWSFAQFGNILIAVNASDDPQYIDVEAGSTAFAALAGSPPRARYVTVIGDFVILAALASNLRKFQNSAINDTTGWTVGVSLSDEQELPDGGRITGIAGGEYGFVVQEKAIRRIIFQPGQDIAFRLERVEQEHGATAGYSVTATANSIFFLSDDGFHAFSGAGLVPIGAQKINKWFRDNSDTSRFFSTLAFTDPYGPRILWAFYNSSSSITFDRLLIYDWQLAQWTYAVVSAQFWATFATAGLTLEQLDVYGALDTGVPYSLDSRVWEGGRPVIAAIDTDGGLSFLEGAPLTASLKTPPLYLNAGWRGHVSSVEPLGIFNDSTLGLVIGKQENSSAVVTNNPSIARSTSSGIFRPKASARLHTFTVDISHTSGTAWTHIQGLDVTARQDGRA